MTTRIVFAAVLAAAAAGCGKGSAPDPDGRSAFRVARIARTDVVRTVDVTGTVTPRNSPSGIPVGAQVNGRIVKLFVDYNSVVTNGQVVALIDPQVYEANHKSALAQLHVNEANVKVREAAILSARAEHALAEKTFARKKALVEKDLAPVSDLDAAEEALAKAAASLESARASLESARASVEQSLANVSQAAANLDYCTIVSPVDGVVIDRKVEEGETVVSSMNAVPVLTIAEDLETVWIEATVPEADIGAIREGQDVTFTADAYRERFKGRVRQIRRAASTVNNVVTFPVIVEAENPGEKLFPGMTVTLSVKTASASGAIAAPAAAFRFRPKEDDRARASGEDEPGPKIWLVNADGTLEARRVSEGVSDDTLTQLVCADADGLVGRDVAVGYQTATRAGGDATTNPFMPKPPRRGTKGTAPEPKTKKTP